MGSQLPDNSLKKLQRNNMIQETKDTVANTVTILGTGSVVMGVSEWLTLVLLITGIVFNVVRICEIRRKRREQ